MRKGIGSHQSARMQKDEWLTPPNILEALGDFDLDPCAPVHRPWSTAKHHYTVLDDGLLQPWHGRVWCNPPYGNKTAHWLKKLANHGNGIALIFARTETKMFIEHVWRKANALLFIHGRLHFHLNHATDHHRCHIEPHNYSIIIGKSAYCQHCGVSKGNSGGPSVLVAYGTNNADLLANAPINGNYVLLKFH